MKNVEMQSLNKVRDELNAGQSQLKRAIETIDRETEGIDRSIRELKIEQEKLEEAKQEADRLKDATDMKPEAAVHEAIYYLGEAMKQEVIDCDVFLKQVRKMARKQFFLKATMIKCRQKAGLPA